MVDEFSLDDLPFEEDFFFDFDPSLVTESPLAEDFVRASPEMIGEIENQLMSDEIQEEQNFVELDDQSVLEFISELFVDCPTSDSGTVELATDKVNAGKEPETSDDSGKKNVYIFVESKSNDSGSEIQDDEGKVESEIEGIDDAVAKKRRRRVRNRDAAVRSRERKKEYVQDLEKKSKYLERECLRLGRMLDCVVAENQSLRLCMQKGNGNYTSMSTKQESAVLSLESLLLGSLLWFLGVNIICQFPQLSNTKCCYLLQTEPEKQVLSGLGSSNIPSDTGVSRRCKGSRPRMKHQILTLVA